MFPRQRNLFGPLRSSSFFPIVAGTSTLVRIHSTRSRRVRQFAGRLAARVPLGLLQKPCGALALVFVESEACMPQSSFERTSWFLTKEIGDQGRPRARQLAVAEHTVVMEQLP